ncbi:cation channel sperm-associated protein 1-like [Branchiostoma floridae]|uniref:Cation channel sperm-associated protein 1-like n=1 Tax=Branchiostoma floridae TaxID=7739 RepID=A0A9J7MHH9_BRAFL|nr:cation channel sperm-associated protein 1-like [Branchiostoma floridae]
MCTKKEGCIPTVDLTDNWTLFAIVIGSIITLGFIKMTFTAVRYGLMDPPKEEEPPKRYRRKRKHHHHHGSHGSHGTHLGSHSHMSHRSSRTDVHHHHKKHSRASLASHEDGAELKTKSKELTSDSKGSGDKQTEESAV